MELLGHYTGRKFIYAYRKFLGLISISIYFNAFSHALRNNKEARVTSSPATTEDWYTAAFSAMKSLYKYTPAKPGDRTLMDALYPCLYALNESKGDIQAAAEAAQRGAKSTRGMKAKLGRTVYVGNVGDVPDPGAVGVAKLIEGMANVLRPGR